MYLALSKNTDIHPCTRPPASTSASLTKVEHVEKKNMNKYIKERSYNSSWIWTPNLPNQRCSGVDLTFAEMSNTMQALRANTGSTNAQCLSNYFHLVKSCQILWGANEELKDAYSCLFSAAAGPIELVLVL